MNKVNPLIVEAFIINHLNPYYFNVQYQSGFLYIFLVCEYFKYYTISQRIRFVFKKLQEYYPEVLKDESVVVETFDTDEYYNLVKNARKTNLR